MIFARRLPRNIAPAEASMEDSHRFVETEQADDKNQKKKNNSPYIILPLITQLFFFIFHIYIYLIEQISHSNGGLSKKTDHQYILMLFAARF